MNSSRAHITNDLTKNIDEKLAAVDKVELVAAASGQLTLDDKKFLVSSYGYSSKYKMFFQHAMAGVAASVPVYQLTRTYLTGASSGWELLSVLAIATSLGADGSNNGIEPIEGVCKVAESRMELYQKQNNGLRIYPTLREAQFGVRVTKMDAMLIASSVAALLSASEYRVLEALAIFMLLYRASQLLGSILDDFGATKKYEVRK